LRSELKDFWACHMEKELYELEVKRLEEEVKRRNAKRVLIQLPDGLKPYGLRLASAVESAGATAIISGDPCYGACDIAISEAKELDVDLIVHYGHTKMLEHVDVPIIYFKAHVRIPIEEVIKKAIKMLKPWKRIGLATTVQHIDDLDEIGRLLSSAGKIVHVGNTCSMLSPGQVLGCNYINAKTIASDVDAFLFFGGGRFHPLGLALATMKPVIAADPFQEKAFSLESDMRKILRRRWAMIEEARKSEIFGVIIGLKPGQKRLKAALEIMEELKRKGKRPYLLALREITSTSLGNFPKIEAYVNTACPRIFFDDSSIAPRPVLTLKEAYVALGKITWENLLKEGII